MGLEFLIFLVTLGWVMYSLTDRRIIPLAQYFVRNHTRLKYLKEADGLFHLYIRNVIL